MAGRDAVQPGLTGTLDWAAIWSPYDAPTYRAALGWLAPGQTVLDIGAGDLRFARLAAELGCEVIAVEQQAEVLARAAEAGPLPPAITVVRADARRWPFPPGLSVAVLLMRHCADYALYTQKLRDAGCPRLVTNARWGMGVECVPLKQGDAYDPAKMGWYACVRCGETGFNVGPPAALTRAHIERTMDVEGCPACQPAAQTT